MLLSRIPCAWPGLELSRRGYLEDLHVQRLVGYDLLQLRIFLLQLLKSPRLVDFHPPVFLLPPDKSRDRNPDLLSCLFLRQTLALLNFSRSEMLNDLLCFESLSRYFDPPLCAQLNISAGPVSSRQVSYMRSIYCQVDENCIA